MLVVSLPGICATKSNYQPGKIVNVEQKTRSRVLYYLVNTPVEKEEPYYEVSIQVGEMVYTGEYSPRHAVDSPPDDWQPGVAVEAKIDKHFFFIKRPYGDDLRLLTVQHKSAPPSERENRNASPKDTQPPK